MTLKSRFFFLLIFLTVLYSSGCRQSVFKADRLREVPDFRLSTLQNPNQKVALLETAKDQPVLLVFWASWCPSCVEEIPALNQLNQQYKPSDLKILSVNVEESPKDILNFMKKQPIDYSVLLDPEGKTAERFGLSGLPALLLLAKGGKIIYYGFSLPANLSELLHQGDLR